MDLIERSSAGGGDYGKESDKLSLHRHNKSQEEIDANYYVSDLVDRLSVKPNKFY